MAMTLEKVKEILALASQTQAAGAKAAAERIVEHGTLRTALDWLVTQHLDGGKREAELVKLCTAVLEATRVMPSIAGQQAINSIGSVSKFDKAIRALRKFVTQLAADAAKETK